MNASTAPTKHLETAGNRFSYRELIKPGTRPIVLLNHLAANLDNWDPLLLDQLSQRQTVAIFDNLGVGSSSGKVPTTIEDMAEDAATFIKAYSDQPVDVIGLSMGGMVTQELAMRYPDLLNKIVLVGTGPRGGKGIDKVTATTFKSIILGALTRSDAKAFIFFKRNPAGKSASKAYLERLASRQHDTDTAVLPGAFISQLKAIKRFAADSPLDLGSISKPVFVINGDNDIMVPTPLSFELAQRIPDAKLEIFPDSGHGSLFQYPSEFAKSVIDFFEE
jgi:pimeloyl-ACP methyl ester carboxylesterase